MTTTRQFQYIQSPYNQPAAQVHIIQPYYDPEIAKIIEWLPWSIINVLLGWILGGIIGLILSLMCRSRKIANDVRGAKKFSLMALIFNILFTLGGGIGWSILIWNIGHFNLKVW